MPIFPPRVIVRDTIDNQITKNVLNACNPGLEARLEFQRGTREFEAVLKTPNGKATLNFVREYNTVNAARQVPAVDIESVVVHKQGTDPESGWKIELNTAFAADLAS